MSSKFVAAALAVMVTMAMPGDDVHASTIPTTVASFSTDAMPVEAGTIDFWARLSGYSGVIPWGTSPYFLVLSDDSTGSSFSIGLNGNDGLGDGGLVGGAGANYSTGSAAYGTPTYESVLGADAVSAWHHYALKWNRNGLGEVSGQKLAVYLDGVLQSTRWDSNCGPPGCGFPSLLTGTLNVIAFGNGSTDGRMAIDEFRIFDGTGHLVLYNTFDSVYAVRHSVIGLNGTFNGYGDPAFVPGVVGNALEATPLFGQIPGAPPPPVPEPQTHALLLAGLALVAIQLRVAASRGLEWAG